jgi:hypothetical protein
MTCELTGKDEYETGDLSIAVDKRVKEKVAEFCGKDSYEVGDLSREIDKRVKLRVAEFTNKADYNFGDISKEIEETSTKMGWRNILEKNRRLSIRRHFKEAS